MLMKTFALVGMLCAATSASVSATTSTVYPHVPLLLWSKRPIFHAQDSYVSAVMDEAQVASTLQGVLTRDMVHDDNHVLNRQEVAYLNPEALCVFLRKDLRTEEIASLGKDSFVQSAIKDAKSSVVVPHTMRTAPLRAAMDAQNPTVVAVDDMQTWTASAEGEALLNNGQTDLLLVEIPDELSLAEADAWMAKAADALQTATNGRTDFALTGNNADPVAVNDGMRRRRLQDTDDEDNLAGAIACEAGYQIGFVGSRAFCFTHYVRMTPNVLIALLFGFFFIFLAYVGLSMLSAIQTPLRYPAQGPPRGKEF